jgi:hypothetical protein
MLLRQSLKTRADVLELTNFVQDRLKRHGAHRSLTRKPKMGGLQMDWLRSEDLKEEKVVTASLAIVAA